MYSLSTDIIMEMETVELCITLVLFATVFVFTYLSFFILLADNWEKGRELWQNVLRTQGVKETFLQRSLHV